MAAPLGAGSEGYLGPDSVMGTCTPRSLSLGLEQQEIDLLEKGKKRDLPPEDQQRREELNFFGRTTTPFPNPRLGAVISDRSAALYSRFR